MSNGSTVSCSGCAFYIPNAANPGNGWCRGAAPLGFVSSQPTYASKVQWPQVGANEWCGEFATVFPPPPPDPLVLTTLTALSTALVKTGPGNILSISVTHGGGATLSVYDGTSASGKLLCNIDTNQTYFNFGRSIWPFATGLFLSLSGNAGVLVVSQ